MNLPVLAMDFLGVFRGMLKKGDPSIWNVNNLPLIHVYGFVKGSTNEECEKSIMERINKYLPNLLHEDIINFQHTKNVTVKKRMYCVTFRIKPEDALMDPIPVVLPNSSVEENENNEEE
jgi:septin family protein